MVEGKEYGVTSSSRPQGGELLATAVPEAVSEEQIISCVLGFLQFPALNLAVPGPSACPTSQISCILSLASGWDSKLQVLRGPIPHPPPRQENLMELPPCCPRKAVARCAHRG